MLYKYIVIYIGLAFLPISLIKINSLNRWAGNTTIRTEDTTIAFERFQNTFTVLTFVKELARIFRHLFFF